jgi:pilus assembly protein Flp/PilA
MSSIARFADDESGATSIEYALIAVIVSIVIVAALNGISNNLNATFSKVVSGISSK